MTKIIQFYKFLNADSKMAELASVIVPLISISVRNILAQG
jgi:hypothetical protein